MTRKIDLPAFPRYLVADMKTSEVVFFSSAKEVGTHLWGRDLARYAVYRNVPLETAEIREIRQALESTEPAL